MVHGLGLRGMFIRLLDCIHFNPDIELKTPREKLEEVRSRKRFA